MRNFSLLLIGLLLFSCSLYADDKPSIPALAESMTGGITVDLREPHYQDGVLTTDAGGVITGPNLRIQALKMRYTRKVVDGALIYTIEAEDQLIVEFGEYVFVGHCLFYDFQKKEGWITQGRTQIEPWYFGGEKIEIRSDGSYLIYDAFVTTSENVAREWQISADEVLVEKKRYTQARRVKVEVYRIPILYIPSLKADLDTIFDSPIRYRFKWGGRQGPRFGLTYEVFSWNHWKTFFRFDYRLTRGPGAGIETHYQSEDHRTQFDSINYIAKDSSLLHLHEKARYRFEGRFKRVFDDNKMSFLLTYDKISDLDLPSTYNDHDFDVETADRTQLIFRRQERNWIGQLYVRVRLNNFQTIKQELPSYTLSFRPLLIGRTGIIFENWAKISYLDFKYANDLHHVKDYDSSRLEYRPKLYRPFSAGPLTLTPEIGGVAIFYGNSPKKQSQWLLLGSLGCEAHTSLYRQYGMCKHVAEPYIRFCSYTYPTYTPRQHFIFDINDGWYKLNRLTFGTRNSLYLRKEDHGISRPFYLDLYTHAFIHSRHLSFIPKIYARLSYLPVPCLRYTVDSAWDFKHSRVDHFNLLTEWTVHTNLAFALEFRHRSSYSWRKVDFDNFFLESYLSDHKLRHSLLSDRRDTVLFHCFYRFHPNWACEIVSRHGWHRFREPSYAEYELDLLTTIQTAWQLKLSFQHREDDNRIALYVNVGLSRPESKDQKRPIFNFE